MRALIADDEPVARQVLREMLEEMPGVEVVGEAGDGLTAVEMAGRLKPDVIFLDLQMPALDGFGVARLVRRGGRPIIIYVTAFDSHALEAFDTGGLDYLLKPVRAERLAAALDKVRAYSPKTPPPALNKILGRAGASLHLLDPAGVVAFQAEGDVVYVRTANQRYYCDHSLRVLEQRLPPDRFRRIHRSTIVNVDHIRTIAPLSSKRWLLKLSNGMEVVVSKRMAAFVRDEIR